MKKHKVFISYHHKKDESYKNELVKLGELNNIFVDHSVDTNKIKKNLSAKDTHNEIRDNFLGESTVTILLVGKNTRRRKHIDWELYSSMRDSQKTTNKKSGILVINLPSIYPYGTVPIAPHGIREKKEIHPKIPLNQWDEIGTKHELQHENPYMPDRIIDNLIRNDVTISVVNWATISYNPKKLKKLIDYAYQNRKNCNYKLNPMRGKNT